MVLAIANSEVIIFPIIISLLVIAEAARLGFKRAMVPAGSDIKIPGIEIMEVARLEQAIARVKIN